MESRLDAVRGRTLVIPLEAPRSAKIPPTIPLRLDDGRTLEAPVFWIGSAPAVPERRLWLPDPGRWSATPSYARVPEGVNGGWFALVDLPEDSPGSGLWFGRVRVPINPIAEPAIIAPTALPWPATAGAQATNLTLNQLARPDAASPLRRWRYALLTEGLAPIFPFTPATGGAGNSDRALQALGDQMQARWQVALAWLYIQHPDLSMHLRRRLASAVIMDGESVAPILPGTEAQLATLLSDLLDPTLSPPDRAARAQSFLDGLPPAVAHVIDDAGQVDARTGGAVSTAMLVNLSRRAAIAWVGVDDAQAPDLEPLAGSSARTLAAPLPVGNESSRGVSFTAHVGDWSAKLEALPAPLPVSPPGRRLAPFSFDWTMEAFVRARPDSTMSPERRWSTAALVHRDTQDSWAVLVECAFDPGDARADDHVELWFGACRTPVSVVRASRDGTLEAVRGPAPGQGSVNVSSDRWTAIVPVPAGAIEPSGILRLGIVRVDARGFRSAWPRPMFPWQEEPGRVSLDTRVWSGRAPANSR